MRSDLYFKDKTDKVLQALGMHLTHTNRGVIQSHIYNAYTMGRSDQAKQLRDVINAFSTPDERT